VLVLQKYIERASNCVITAKDLKQFWITKADALNENLRNALGSGQINEIYDSAANLLDHLNAGLPSVDNHFDKIRTMIFSSHEINALLEQFEWVNVVLDQTEKCVILNEVLSESEKFAVAIRGARSMRDAEISKDKAKVELKKSLVILEGFDSNFKPYILDFINGCNEKIQAREKEIEELYQQQETLLKTKVESNNGKSVALPVVVYKSAKMQDLMHHLGSQKLMYGGGLSPEKIPFPGMGSATGLTVQAVKQMNASAVKSPNSARTGLESME
jgi:hypothetical protein